MFLVMRSNMSRAQNFTNLHTGQKGVFQRNSVVNSNLGNMYKESPEGIFYQFLAR